jgi:hypothetical protein
MSSSQVKVVKVSLMASNYNLVPRPAVILVDKGTVQVMERRETYADIVSRYQEFERDQGYMLSS